MCELPVVKLDTLKRSIHVFAFASLGIVLDLVYQVAAAELVYRSRVAGWYVSMAECYFECAEHRIALRAGYGIQGAEQRL